MEIKCIYLFDRVTDIETRQKFWFTHVFLAGATAGVVKAVFACPIELSKVRLQVKVSKLPNPERFYTTFSNLCIVKTKKSSPFISAYIFSVVKFDQIMRLDR